ncbi:MAG: hypothetical protein KC416_17205, partial [Myxococcales bacterium]|nr:hypothetical protein [Myxococcales bacterium]
MRPSMVPQYAPDGRGARFVKSLRHPLRVVAVGGAVFSMVSGIAGTAATVSAVVGAVTGVLLGEWIGRSLARTAAVVLLGATFGLLTWGLAAIPAQSAAVASFLGADTSLSLQATVRSGGFFLAVVTVTRTLGRRHPSLLSLEFVLFVLALVVVFASHRDGVIARPLWLSDWAWHRGMDPSQVLMAIGATGAFLMSVLLVLEGRRGVTVASVLVVPFL